MKKYFRISVLTLAALFVFAACDSNDGTNDDESIIEEEEQEQEEEYLTVSISSDREDLDKAQPQYGAILTANVSTNIEGEKTYSWLVAGVEKGTGQTYKINVDDQMNELKLAVKVGDQTKISKAYTVRARYNFGNGTAFRIENRTSSPALMDADVANYAALILEGFETDQNGVTTAFDAKYAALSKMVKVVIISPSQSGVDGPETGNNFVALYIKMDYLNGLPGNDFQKLSQIASKLKSQINAIVAMAPQQNRQTLMAGLYKQTKGERLSMADAAAKRRIANVRLG